MRFQSARYAMRQRGGVKFLIRNPVLYPAELRALGVLSERDRTSSGGPPLGRRGQALEGLGGRVAPDHHVRGLEIAVRETRRVCGLEPAPRGHEHSGKARLPWSDHVVVRRQREAAQQRRWPNAPNG